MIIDKPETSIPIFNIFFLPKRSNSIPEGTEKIKKPDPCIYQLTLERYNLVAENVVFIDDKTENVTAAKNLGIHGIHFTNPETLKKTLEHLGVLH